MAARDVTVAQGLGYPVAGGRSIRVQAKRLARRGEAACLVVVMAMGSIGMWTAVPAGGLWLASEFTESATQPTTASALMTMLGIPMVMALTGVGLARLEHRYLYVTGQARRPRVPAYRRSISDSSSSPDATVLEVLMVVSVLVAAVAFAVWFSLFAGSSLLP